MSSSPPSSLKYRIFSDNQHDIRAWCYHENVTNHWWFSLTDIIKSIVGEETSQSIVIDGIIGKSDQITWELSRSMHKMEKCPQITDDVIFINIIGVCRLMLEYLIPEIATVQIVWFTHIMHSPSLVAVEDYHCYNNDNNTIKLLSQQNKILTEKVNHFKQQNCELHQKLNQLKRSLNFPDIGMPNNYCDDYNSGVSCESLNFAYMTDKEDLDFLFDVLYENLEEYCATTEELCADDANDEVSSVTESMSEVNSDSGAVAVISTTTRDTGVHDKFEVDFNVKKTLKNCSEHLKCIRKLLLNTHNALSTGHSNNFESKSRRLSTVV